MRPPRSARRSSRFYRPLLLELETRVVPSFVAPRAFDAGDHPQSVAVGDFNGDGKPDLAVVNFSSSNVGVLLGNGDGTFQPTQTFAVGSIPESVAVGDFNGDGNLDLVVVNGGRNSTVSVLLGNGDGSFQPAQTFPAGNGANSVAVGDFNGDGILDLVVANIGTFPDYTDSSMSVLLGNGDGSFQPARSFAAGTRPMSMAVGDFNGDGILDLAVADYGDAFGQGQGVGVLLGNGDGSFQPARTFNAGTTPVSVAVGDFNGYGTPDLVVADKGDINGGSGVSVLLGNGNGSFQPARTFNAGSSPASVVLGDFNDDGILDLAVLDYGSVRILLGNGDGSFQTTNVSYIAGRGPRSVAVGDFNGDGWPDLAVANNYSNDVSILINDGIWAGPHPGPSGGASRGGRFPGRDVGGPKRPAARHSAALAEAPWVEAAFPDVRHATPAGAVADPTPAPLPRDNGRSASPVTPTSAPRREEAPLVTRARPAALRPALLDLAFADGESTGGDARLVGDRGLLPA